MVEAPKVAELEFLRSVKNVLVTGGAGFLGSRVVRSCLAGSNKVRVVDNLKQGSLENLGARPPD